MKKKLETAYLFQTSDKRFALKFSETIAENILKYCREAYPNETGGTIAGRYSDDRALAVVTQISGPPFDSKSGRTWFVSGIQGLKEWFKALWGRGEYYLGEWHFHPDGSSNPSSTDIEQMCKIAATKNYHCPEPLMLIIGGNPTKRNSSTQVFVFPRGQGFHELLPVSRPLDILA